jgi:hypothetical protein
LPLIHNIGRYVSNEIAAKIVACYVEGNIAVGDQDAGKVMSTVWAALVLVLATGITAVWIGVLGFGLVHLIEHAI